MKTRMICFLALAWAGTATAEDAAPSMRDAAASPHDTAPQSAYVRPAPIHAFVEQDQDAAASTTGSMAPAPKPPRGARVAIARGVVDAAGAFDGYMRRATRIGANFAGGESVSRAVELGSAFEPGQIGEGVIAYAALAALQDPDFVAAVREQGGDPGGRDDIATRLVDHPEAVLDTAAARVTATRVAALLGDMGVKLVTAGAAVKQAATDLQSEAWSRQALVDPDKRLARIKAQSAVAVSLAPSDTARLFGDLAALRAAESARTAEARSVTPVVARGLALAALAILGRAGEDRARDIARLVADDADTQCLQRAKNDEYQCLAVTGPRYEDVFCLGTHAMVGPGRCVAAAAGVDEDTLRPLLDTASVYVPIAVAAPETAERDAASSPARSGDVMAPTAEAPTQANYSPYEGPPAH